MNKLIDPHHFEHLARLNPADVCRRALCTYDESNRCYELQLWGKSCRIYPAKGEITRDGDQRPSERMLSLFAVHLLLTCIDVQPAGRWISEKDMAGGVTFFRGPHEIPTQLITNSVSGSLTQFKHRCEQLKGTPIEMADAAYVFNISDRTPVAILFWEGDEDFPAETRLLFDSTLSGHFALDIVFALATGVCEEFAGRGFE